MNGRTSFAGWATELILILEAGLALLLVLAPLAAAYSAALFPEPTPLMAVCSKLGTQAPRLSEARELATYCATLRSTIAAEHQATLALVSVILLAATLVPTAIAAIYTARQALLGRRGLVQEHRPWVLVEDFCLTSGLRVSADEARIDFRLIARNVGRTPARGVDLWPLLHIDWRVPAGDAQRVHADTLGGAPRDWGTTIFPNQQCTFNHSIGVSKTQWEDFFTSMNDSFPDAPPWEMISLALVGSITYGSVLGGEVYKTGFAYDVRRKQFMDPKLGPSVAIRPAAGDVALGELELHLAWSDPYTD